MKLPRIKPQLIIEYSWIYDKQIQEWKGLKYTTDYKKAKKYRDKLQKKWNKFDKKIFDSISKVSGLKWKKQVIDCYLVTKTTPFSMPMTIPMRTGMRELIETITHELVHNILVQNWDRIIKKDYKKKYGEMSKKAEIHILVHSILKEAMINVFGEKKTKKYIKKKQENLSDYKTAWDIVEKEGSKRVIIDCIK